MISKIPLIALVGLPNSGKSTLINKLTGTKVAIESKEAHTTRDLNYGEDFWDGYYLRFVDTGGLVPDAEDKIQSAVQQKSWKAIAESDLLIWVIDRKKEPETISQKIISKVWKSGKPFIICINKVDDPNLERDISEFAFLGGNGFANVSCNTGYGTDVLMKVLTEQLEKLGFKQNFEPDINLGRHPKGRGKREKTSDVKINKDGSYYIVRNDDGVFQSIEEDKLDDELEGRKQKEYEELGVQNIVVDLNGVLFTETIKQTSPENLQGVNLKVLDFLCSQKMLGKKIYWLSNSTETETAGRENLSFWRIFNGGVDSFESEFKKPQPEFYKEFLAKFKLKSNSCLYLDNIFANFRIAEKLGFKSVHFTLETNLEKEVLEAQGLDYRLPKVLFLGRPNVGKSSLFNAMAQEDLQIVTDVAGTTMSVNDAIIEKHVEKIYEFTNSSKARQTEDKQKYLIFDFDGVLGDTYKSAIEANMEISGQSVEEVTKIIDDHFSKVKDAHKNHHIESKEVKKKIAGDDFRNLLISKNIIQSKLFEGFLEEIESLENSKLAIVSSGDKKYILPMLGDFASMFDYILDYQDSLSKEEKVEMVCKNWGISEKETYYFTDTQTDVLELDQYMDKTKVIGCSWGFQGYKKLLDVLPKTQILKEFKSLHKLLAAEDAKIAAENNLSNPATKIKIRTTKPYILLDSVGIRRPGQRTVGVETFATFRTVQAANEADVICLVVDGSQNLSHQDQVVAGVAKEAKKGIVVVVNKADLFSRADRKKFIDEFEYKFGFLHVEGFIWISAKKASEKNEYALETRYSKIHLTDEIAKEEKIDKKKVRKRASGVKEMYINLEDDDITNTNQIWEMIDKCLLERSREIKKEDLRKIFNYIVKRKPPQKLRTEKKAILYDLIYFKKNPPTFHLLVKDRDSIHWSFTRFLENILRENFGFKNTEIKVKLVEVERKNVLSF